MSSHFLLGLDTIAPVMANDILELMDQLAGEPNQADFVRIAENKA